MDYRQEIIKLQKRLEELEKEKPEKKQTYFRRLFNKYR